jgi:hypothetical protein
LREKKLISLNDDYFYSLSQYTDPRYIKSYCEAIPPTLLRTLCLSGMAFFYGVSFTLRPWRMFKLLRDVWKMTPQTKLGDALVRIRKKREKLRFARAA